MLAYRPSQMAAAASLLAMTYFNQPTDFGWVQLRARGFLTLAPLR